VATVVIPVQTREMKKTRARQLVRLIYVQAIFLSLAYAAGVFVTFNVFGPSIGTSQVIGHGILASSFGVATALVALVASVQGMRRVALLNIVLFAVAVVGGTTGFEFLGDSSTFSAIENTNMFMTAVVAVGMPVTGLSLAAVSKTFRDVVAGEKGRRLPLAVTYASLASLALTLIAGVGMTSTRISSTMKTAHFAFAGLTLALVVVLVLITLRGALGRRSQPYMRRRLPISFVSLLFIAAAVASGAIFLYIGGITYVYEMAVFAVLLYAFLLLGIELPS
jgi:hypothetical protein